MENTGIAWPLFLAQLANMAILVAWLVAAGIALRQLGRRSLSERLRVVWALIILCIPLLGALTFFFARPGVSRTY